MANLSNSRPASNGMRLLVCVQAIDRADPTLSFFLQWVRELSKHYESLHVVCLQKGEHDLPQNIKVHSLGKEQAHGSRGLKRLRYLLLLWRYVWSLREEYDAVLVLQNQEYPLTTGWLWTLLKKPVYLWRNHYEGDWLTDVAIYFCKKVFFTSRYSYTAKSEKGIKMPVGIDTNIFKTLPDIRRNREGILFLARMAPSKNPNVVLGALRELDAHGVPFQAAFVGDPLAENKNYYENLKEVTKKSPISDRVTFERGVPNAETPRIYNAYSFFVNASKSGMFDKTIFEAAACGCIVLAASLDFAEDADPRCIFTYGNDKELAAKLETLTSLSDVERSKIISGLQTMVAKNDISVFGTRLAQEIQ